MANNCFLTICETCWLQFLNCWQIKVLLKLLEFLIKNSKFALVTWFCPMSYSCDTFIALKINNFPNLWLDAQLLCEFGDRYKKVTSAVAEKWASKSAFSECSQMGHLLISCWQAATFEGKRCIILLGLHICYNTSAQGYSHTNCVIIQSTHALKCVKVSFDKPFCTIWNV